jgi:hypothetical protein
MVRLSQQKVSPINCKLVFRIKPSMRLCRASDSHAASQLPTFAPQILSFRIRAAKPPQNHIQNRCITLK